MVGTVGKGRLVGRECEHCGYRFAVPAGTGAVYCPSCGRVTGEWNPECTHDQKPDMAKVDPRVARPL